ncbi:uncharacterized protein LOC112510376 [Cynara cardunculus var. scolymus]|nr:uncharacterized protein LOC112510376 [Cynara cardunculus var. scolymus]
MAPHPSSPGYPMATFCCPIETEPKTLNQVELNHVREVAVGVLKDNEPSEANRILSEGMKPIMGVKEMTIAIERKDSIHKLQGTVTVGEAICQCSVVGPASTPDQHNLKEPLSAPF